MNYNDVIESYTTTTPAHADEFNQRQNKLIENIEYARFMAEKGKIQVAPVSNFQANNFDDTASLSLSWSNPPNLVVQDSNGDDITLATFDHVEIRRNTGSYPTQDTGTLVYEGANTTYTDTGLTYDTQYYYSIWAVTTDSVYSEVAQDFGTPLNLSYDLQYGITNFEGNGATASGDTAELSWTNPTETDFTGVLIIRGTAEYPATIDSGTLVADITDGSETYNDTGLITDEIYYYTAWAYNDTAQYSASQYEANVEVTVIMGQDPTGSPGPAVLQAGDEQAGYFGLVSASELFTGLELASELGISQGTSQFDNVDYIKYMYEGKVRFRPLKQFRHSISWDYLYEAGAVYGDGLLAGETGAEHHNTEGYDRTLTATRQDAQVSKDGITYRVGLMNVTENDPTNSYADADRDARNSEYNAIVLPLHAKAPDSFAYPEYADNPTPDWRHATPDGTGFTDEDLHTDSSYGDGTYLWGQETRNTSPSYRLNRGSGGASYAISIGSSNTGSGMGWLPRLEVVE